ncbi:MAG: hypothetical protein ACXWXB_00995 [Actinomycetota bacterium]
MIALLGTGCAAPSSTDPPAVADPIEILSSPTPFTQVNAGPVSAIVPDGWEPHPPVGNGFRGGFLASPHPERWRLMDGGVPGMSATWVDATQVGMPSDFYYLAATGSLLSSLTDSRRCSAETRRVFVNRRPEFSTQGPSHGDYVARGEGTCEVRGIATRWAYFVAAPGYGPVREIGIPASGLYVVVAVTPDGDRAASLLDRLIRHTSFGGSSVDDLVDAVGSGFRAR